MYGVEPRLTIPNGMPLPNDVPPAFLTGADVWVVFPPRNQSEDQDSSYWGKFRDDRADQPSPAEYNDISTITDYGCTTDADDLSLIGGSSDDDDFLNDYGIPIEVRRHYFAVLFRHICYIIPLLRSLSLGELPSVFLRCWCDLFRSACIRSYFKSIM